MESAEDKSLPRNLSTNTLLTPVEKESQSPKVAARKAAAKESEVKAKAKRIEQKHAPSSKTSTPASKRNTSNSVAPADSKPVKKPATAAQKQHSSKTSTASSAKSSQNAAGGVPKPGMASRTKAASPSGVNRAKAQSPSGVNRSKAASPSALNRTKVQSPSGSTKNATHGGGKSSQSHVKAKETPIQQVDEDIPSSDDEDTSASALNQAKSGELGQAAVNSRPGKVAQKNDSVSISIVEEEELPSSDDEIPDAAAAPDSSQAVLQAPDVTKEISSPAATASVGDTSIALAGSSTALDVEELPSSDEEPDRVGGTAVPTVSLPADIIKQTSDSDGGLQAEEDGMEALKEEEKLKELSVVSISQVPQFERMDFPAPVMPNSSDSSKLNTFIHPIPVQEWISTLFLPWLLEHALSDKGGESTADSPHLLWKGELFSSFCAPKAKSLDLLSRPLPSVPLAKLDEAGEVLQSGVSQVLACVKSVTSRSDIADVAAAPMVLKLSASFQDEADFSALKQFAESAESNLQVLEKREEAIRREEAASRMKKFGHALPNGHHQEETAKLAKSDAVFETLQVRVVTWNMAGTVPWEFRLSTLLPGDKFHIFSICSQECENSIAKSLTATDRPEWRAKVLATLGPAYEEVCHQTLGATNIVLVAKKSIRHLISGCYSHAISLGMKGLAPNKGCCAVRCCIGDSSIVFGSMHLTAHQNMVKERNRDMEKVNQGIAENFGDVDDLNAVILGGDMNYRVDISFTEIMDIIQSNDHSTAVEKLLQKDQLTNARSNIPAFKGYLEAPIRFMPTYKFKPHTSQYDDGSRKKKPRPPSWTDRVLYRSRYPVQLECLAYDSHKDLLHSDHRPVVADFALTVPVSLVDPNAANYHAEQRRTLSSACSVQ